ncbi:uncharacterized protein C22orf15 homolog [Discoglossus pictus]
MFVTVKYGDDNQIILNTNCRIVNLTESLKEKCQCEADASIDLLDESGNLINLCDLEGSQDNAINYLKERQRYILVRINKGDGSEPARYESMLDNLGKRHPELAERLQKLSHPNIREKGRLSVHKKARPPKEVPLPPPTKIRSVSQQKSRP